MVILSPTGVRQKPQGVTGKWMSRWWLLGLRSQLGLHLLLCMGSSPDIGSLDRCSHIGDGWVVCANRCSVFHIFYRLCSRYVIRKLRIYIFLYTRSTLWDYRYWIIQKCYQLLCVWLAFIRMIHWSLFSFSTASPHFYLFRKKHPTC